MPHPENYFLLLDLDPHPPWNQAKFERALAAKQQQWARLVNHPARGAQAKRNLSLIPKIKQALADEAQREEQAGAARKLLKVGQKAKREEFEDSLRLMESKGFLTKTEVTNLVKQYKGVFSEAGICKKISVPVQDEETGDKGKQPQLDRSTAKKIESLLTIVSKKDLYDFLEATPKTRRSDLEAASKRLYRQVQLHTVKTPEITAQSELTGYCMRLFKSDTERDRYNETLHQVRFENLRKKLDNIGKSTRTIYAAQVEVLLRDAKSEGLNLETARRVIKEHAHAKKWSMDVPPLEAVAKLQVCGACRTVNQPEDRHCIHCGESLQIECPRCQQTAASDQMACASCGFPVGNRRYTRYLLQESLRARKELQYNDAQKILEQAAQAWSRELKDPLSREIAQAIADVAALRQRQHETRAQLQELANQRQFFALQIELVQAARILPKGAPELETFRQAAEKAIREAEVLFAKARQAEAKGGGDPVMHYQDVLRVCRDHQGAKEVLVKTPPQPPTQLRAQVGSGVVSLCWQPGSSRGVRYRVVRKYRTRPVSPGDGESLAVVAGHVYDDTGAETGLPVYYAVFADRESIPSTSAAQLSTPVLLIEDVRNVIKQIDTGVVQLSWEPSPNVHQIIVVRSEHGFPRSPTNGLPVATLDKRQLVDRGLTNGQKYFYTLFCEFRDHMGGTVFSPGVNLDAIPQSPPTPPVLSLHVTDEQGGHEVQLTWSKPVQGEVAILKSNTAPVFKPGDVLPSQHLETLGALLPALNNQLVDCLKRLGTVYYTPVVLFQGMGYAGKTIHYTCLNDVGGIHVQNLGHVLRVHWEWPPDCEQVLIAIGYEGWPDLEDRQTVQVPMSRAEYDIRGYYDIQQPGERDHFIVVHAVILQDGRRLVAPGLAAGARRCVTLGSRISLRYEIQKPFFGRQFQMRLKLNSPGRLPRLVLVRKSGRLPMNINDGEIIFELDPLDAETQFSVKLPPDAARPRAFAKLFLENSDLYGAVVIRHPGQDKLRLFK